MQPLASARGFTFISTTALQSLNKCPTSWKYETFQKWAAYGRTPLTPTLINSRVTRSARVVRKLRKLRRREGRKLTFQFANDASRIAEPPALCPLCSVCPTLQVLRFISMRNRYVLRVYKF